MTNLSILKNKLIDLGYKVSVFDSKNEATKYLSNQIVNQTVGIGGSLTVEQMGLYEVLIKNNKVWWHWRIPSNMTDKKIRQQERDADIYISSVNGLAETGEIVNIDATCNRVADIFYGHKKVYLIIGVNKIAENLEKAIFRARNISAPLNAKRLNRKTPCAINADKCYDCKSADRICRGLSIIWQKPLGSEYEIILVNENLGY